MRCHLPLRRLSPRNQRFCGSRSFATASSDNKVRIVEVGPRDGLQNEKTIIPTQTKLDLISRLALTGLEYIEAGAYVSKKAIPQMADASVITQFLVLNRPQSSQPISYSFLVPNSKGIENAILSHRDAILLKAASDAEVGPPKNESASPSRRQIPSNVDEIAVFGAATESFSRANINCSIQDSLERFQKVIAIAKDSNIRVRAYLSCVLGCPYEGRDVSPAKIAGLASQLLDMGADELSFGDTIGTGTPERTEVLLKNIRAAGIPKDRTAMHFHDTYGNAIPNTQASLNAGIRIFDSSVGGLGGCPYAKGATGNVATEKMTGFLHSAGLSTGVDLEKISEIGRWIRTIVGRKS